MSQVAAGAPEITPEPEKTIYFVRHCESEANVASLKDPVAKFIRPPLCTEKGVNQAYTFGLEKLPAMLGPGVQPWFYSSMLPRAIWTAALIRSGYKEAKEGTPQNPVRVIEDAGEYWNPIDYGTPKVTTQNKTSYEESQCIQKSFPAGYIYKEEPPSGSSKSSGVCKVPPKGQRGLKRILDQIEKYPAVLVVHGQMMGDMLGVSGEIGNLDAVKMVDRGDGFKNVKVYSFRESLGEGELDKFFDSTREYRAYKTRLDKCITDGSPKRTGATLFAAGVPLGVAALMIARSGVSAPASR